MLHVNTMVRWTTYPRYAYEQTHPFHKYQFSTCLPSSCVTPAGASHMHHDVWTHVQKRWEKTLFSTLQQQYGLVSSNRKSPCRGHTDKKVSIMKLDNDSAFLPLKGIFSSQTSVFSAQHKVGNTVLFFGGMDQHRICSCWIDTQKVGSHFAGHQQGMMFGYRNLNKDDVSGIVH